MDFLAHVIGPENGAQFLADAGEALAKTFDLSTSLPRAAQLASEYLDAICFVEASQTSGADRLATAAGATEAQRRAIEALRTRPDGSKAPFEEIALEGWRAAGWLRSPSEH